MSELTTQRIVPGAPPPAPLSKSQRKKLKAKARAELSGDASGQDAPAGRDTEAAAEANADVASGVDQKNCEAVAPLAPLLPEEEVLLKPSPIIELIHKRLKATTKKIGRITVYASMDPEKLNDDQKCTLHTLPTLEAIQKELGEVKKAIEAHETELAKELAVKRVEAEISEKARIAEAVAAAQAAAISKTSNILNLLRLRSWIVSGELDISGIADEAESAALHATAGALLGDDDERKDAAIKSFMTGVDVADNISYSRLLEINATALNPPRAPSPLEELVDSTPDDVAVATPSLARAETASGIPEPLAIQSGFHFMQESELESGSFEGSVEWVERPDAGAGAIAFPGTTTEVHAVNGHAPPVGVAPTMLDWSAESDYEGIPPISEVKADLGMPEPHYGEETPLVSIPQPRPTAAPAPLNSVRGDGATGGRAEDDGFTQARGGRERGRVGYRGGRAYRGFCGGFRGGDRGGQGWGERGGRGEWNGGRGHRGGRGRGRGAPPAAAAPTAA